MNNHVEELPLCIRFVDDDVLNGLAENPLLKKPDMFCKRWVSMFIIAGTKGMMVQQICHLKL